jgi:hypothetical protein
MLNMTGAHLFFPFSPNLNPDSLLSSSLVYASRPCMHKPTRAFPPFSANLNPGSLSSSLIHSPMERSQGQQEALTAHSRQALRPLCYSDRFLLSDVCDHRLSQCSASHGYSSVLQRLPLYIDSNIATSRHYR